VERPPITLTCECGESAAVPYGERWQCSKCRRTWDTSQIPEEDYEAVLRIQRRYRIVPMVLLVLAAAAVVLLVVLGRVLAVVFLPLVLTLWFMFVRPLQRKRLKAQVAALPEWKLTPE
jgi:Flp pilus assembly protein TadB